MHNQSQSTLYTFQNAESFLGQFVPTKFCMFIDFQGTPLYMAPELIEEKPYDLAADLG